MIYSTLSETFTYHTFRCSIDILKDEVERELFKRF